MIPAGQYGKLYGGSHGLETLDGLGVVIYGHNPVVLGDENETCKIPDEGRHAVRL